MRIIIIQWWNGLKEKLLFLHFLVLWLFALPLCLRLRHINRRVELRCLKQQHRGLNNWLIIFMGHFFLIILRFILSWVWCESLWWRDVLIIYLINILSNLIEIIIINIFSIVVVVVVDVVTFDILPFFVAFSKLQIKKAFYRSNNLFLPFYIIFTFA